MTATVERPGGQYVVTEGDRHTLYGPDGTPVKTWTGQDEAGASTYHVNDDGTLTLTDPDGAVTHYDEKGAPIDQTTPDGWSTKFDDKGRPIEATDQNGNHFKFTWDDNDGVTITDDQGISVHYDSTGHRNSTTFPDGEKVDWSVELPRLKEAIGKVEKERDSIAGEVTSLKSKVDSVSEYWQSP